MLYINPSTCIDCNLCVAECPVEAIYSEEELPPGQEPYLAINAELSRDWPVITQRGEPPADADQWKDVREKTHLLER